MSAAALLEACRAAGLSIEADGEHLIVEAVGDLPSDLLAELRAHKPEIIAALTAAPDDIEERAAIVEFGAGVPRRWAEGFAALSSMPPPTGFSPERWHRIVDAAGVFLDRWAVRAAECGWSDLDVFGADPDRPPSRFDAMGLLLLLYRAEVVGIDKDGADLLVNPGAARQRYRRRPVPDGTVSLWDLTSRSPGSAA
jgi:TubC N-terminal docking domain